MAGTETAFDRLFRADRSHLSPCVGQAWLQEIPDKIRFGESCDRYRTFSFSFYGLILYRERKCPFSMREMPEFLFLYKGPVFIQTAFSIRIFGLRCLAEGCAKGFAGTAGNFSAQQRGRECIPGLRQRHTKMPLFPKNRERGAFPFDDGRDYSVSSLIRSWTDTILLILHALAPQNTRPWSTSPSTALISAWVMQ